MRFETGGAIPARPDFDVLKAGLAAAQAATPTARASVLAHPRIDRAEALIRLFAQDGATDGRVLRGSFHPALPLDGAEPAKMTAPFTLAFEASFKDAGLNTPSKGIGAGGGERED